MNKKIDDIIKELLMIDPSFAEHENEIRTLIAELIAKKPDARLDPEFVARLRARLLGEPTRSPFTIATYLPYGIVAALAVLLVVPFGYYITQQGPQSPVFAMNQQIEKVGRDAYGTLALQESGRGGGASSNMAPQASAPETTSFTTSMGMGGDAKMMLPQGPITVYSYVYKGAPLELSGEGEVYARVKSQVSSGQIATQLKKFNFGLINLGAYTDLRVRSFELAEDKPYGYSITASFDDGMISINPNYTQWPGLNGKEMATQLPLSAMLKDEEVIAIAKKFLDDHQISLANFGEPSIQGAPEMGIADTQPQFAPEQVTVTYPLRISGAQVMEDGAYPYGLQVGVSIKDKRVMSVYGLTSQTYQSSSYKLETDSTKILSVLAKGGPHAWVPQESDRVTIKKVEVEVGAPEKILMHSYTYANGESKELFVPALSFPVTKAPTGDQYYPKSIVIPLVPEILNQESGPVIYDTLR